MPASLQTDLVCEQPDAGAMQELSADAQHHIMVFAMHASHCEGVGAGVGLGVGADVGAGVGISTLPFWQCSVIVHAAQVLLPSGQNAPAGHTFRSELLGQ